MDRMYFDANDKNVAAVVVYANSSNKIFYDATAKDNLVPAEDCMGLFVKGVVCKKGNTYYKAKSCTEAGVIDFGITA